MIRQVDGGDVANCWRYLYPCIVKHHRDIERGTRVCSFLTCKCDLPVYIFLSLCTDAPFGYIPCNPRYVQPRWVPPSLLLMCLLLPVVILMQTSI